MCLDYQPSLRVVATQSQVKLSNLMLGMRCVHPIPLWHVSHQVRSFKFPKREKMEALKEQWVKDCGSTPVGNVKGSEWSSGSKEAQVRKGTTNHAGETRM